MNELWSNPTGILYVAVSHVMGAGEEYYLEVVDDIECLSCQVMAQIETRTEVYRLPIEKLICLSPFLAMQRYLEDHVRGKLEWLVTSYVINTSLLFSEGVIQHNGADTKFIEDTEFYEPFDDEEEELDA